MIYYHQAHDPVARLWFDFWRRHGRNACFLPEVLAEGSHYLARYGLLREFFRHLLPFSLVGEGGRAVQVGFHDQYIATGCSHAMMLASVVGPSGAVWTLDPDEKNVAAMDQYTKQERVPHVRATRIGVWSVKGEIEFVQFSDFSSSNTAAETFSGFREGAEKRWSRERIEQKSRKVRFAVDTLDNLLAPWLEDGRGIDLLNITVNGAEPHVLKGASRVLDACPGARIGFPLANVDEPTLADLRSRGFQIGLADMPHRPWETEQFMYACALRVPPAYLLERGFVPVRLKVASRLADDAVGRFEIVPL
jgi:FkbM family methyltransferase